MSHYHITPEANWADWKSVAAKANVSFTKEQETLGEALLKASTFPEPEEQLLQVIQYYSINTVERLVTEGSVFNHLHIPVHPIALLTFAQGLRVPSNTGNPWCKHLSYETTLSPYLLAHPEDNRNFLFLLKWNADGLYGEFLDLSIPKNNTLPRSMYVWGYKNDKYHKRHKRSLSDIFHLDENGVYGDFYTRK